MAEYKDMSFLDAVKYLPTRLINAISKLIGMKGVVLVITIYLIKNKLLPDSAVGYTWIFIVLIVVFGEKALAVLKDIKK